MTKYYVNNYDSSECIYEGFDEAEAYRICNEYSSCCGDWYVDEVIISDEGDE